MTDYDSLAEQVAEDFRMTMLAISQVQQGVKKVEQSIEKVYDTIQIILADGKRTNVRLEALEDWKKTVDARLTA